MNLTILGAGAWGTALAIGAVKAAQAAAAVPAGPGLGSGAAAPLGAHAVMLWARDAAQADDMGRSRCNARYLPGVVLPDGLAVTSDLDVALRHGRSGLFVIGTPMAALRGMLSQLPADSAVAWLCKGFEAGSGRLGHEVAQEVAREAGRPLRVAVLSGPSFAAEVARGQPTALVAASGDEALRRQLVQAFHGESLRIYTSADPIGVEVGGAVKNVLAIATGIADGMALGLNARAALITRGLAEMTRLGLALGAQAETFMGLSGLGDLVLTATGDLSRNRQVGLQLAQGASLADILQRLGHVAEGVYSAPTVLDRARALGVDMPLTAAVVEVLQGRLAPAQALRQLMSREARAEAP
jgi:glycerol-3-phosphate dehydrogenase (NAD(P)+)